MDASIFSSKAASHETMRSRAFGVGLCSLFFVAAISAVASATDPPTFLRKWGEFGYANGQFSSPNGICVDRTGNLYVADLGNHRVQKFAEDGSFLGTFGTEGNEPGQFTYPRDVAVDAVGHIFVSDSYRIQVFDANFAFLRQWFTQPIAAGKIALDPTEQFLYVGAGTQILKYDVLGNLVLSWMFSSVTGSIGPGIGVGPSGSVYVTAQVAQKIRQYSADGTFITEWGGHAPAPGMFMSPQALGVDQGENIFVADGDSRLQRFSAEGEFQALWGSVGTRDGEFYSVVDFAFDNSTVFVLDHDLNEIQVFSDPTTPTLRTSWGGIKLFYR